MDKQKSRDVLAQERQKYDAYVLPLWCPITKNRIVYPARGSQCTHVKVFDAKTFLEHDLKMCPICNKEINKRYIF